MTRRLWICLLACLLLLAAFPAHSHAARVRTPEKQYHRVEKGETLGSIAELYGMSVRELKKLNHVRRPKRLRAGAKILVRGRRVDPSPVEASAGAVPEPATAGISSEPEPKAIPGPAAAAGDNGAAGLSAEKSGLEGIKERLVRVARKMIDIPYRYGGASFIGIDCSAYVQMVYGLFDVVLPRTAREQFHLGKLVGLDNLSIGDLVFFRTTAKFPSHVGIYLGDNKFIHASSKDHKVKIDSLTAPYYIKRFVGGRRIPLERAEEDL